MPFFSVIIPAYNAEKYIFETIDSVLAQTIKDIEIIVIDDGSTDNTLGIVSSFGNKINLVQQGNAGAAAARNKGAEIAKGVYLAFLDADDLWLPEKLEIQRKKISDGYHICYTNRYNIGDIGDLPHKQSDIQHMPEGDIFTTLLKQNIITNSSVVIQKNIFKDVGGCDSSLGYCEDWDLWLRCANDHKIGFCPTPLVQYRMHPAGKSKNYKEQHKARKKIITAALSTERGKKLPHKEQKEIWAQLFQTAAWTAARSKDFSFALSCQIKALRKTPCNADAWYNLARIIAHRA